MNTKQDEPVHLARTDEEVLDALNWASNEVLRLDAENQRLKERLRDYEQTFGDLSARGTC